MTLGHGTGGSTSDLSGSGLQSLMGGLQGSVPSESPGLRLLGFCCMIFRLTGGRLGGRPIGSRSVDVVCRPRAVLLSLVGVMVRVCLCACLQCLVLFRALCVPMTGGLSWF